MTFADITRQRFSTAFSLGFRPFFLAAGIWACVSMAAWILFVSGHITFPATIDPLRWHVHALLFGYLGAAIAGFLLTAVPNWTKQTPVTGVMLAGLFLLWVAGRVVTSLPTGLSLTTIALIDLAFPLVLFATVAGHVWQGKNWRNLSVLSAIALWIGGNAVFHLEPFVALEPGTGARLGLAGAVTLVSIVGGRVVPNFTRNWLKKNGGQGLRAASDTEDYAANTLLAATAILWALYPSLVAAAVLLSIIGFAHLLRLSLWNGWATRREPLLWVLHLAYLFVPLGAFALAASTTGIITPTSALHVWTAGAVGLMTLAIMTRATLGHSGGELTADWGTAACYLVLAASAIMRPLAYVFPVFYDILISGSAITWLLAFAGYVALYGPRQLGFTQT